MADGFERFETVFFHFDDKPFGRADGIDRGEDRFEVDRTAADFLFVLEVDEANAPTLLADKGGGIFAAGFYPVDISLVTEVGGTARIEQQSIPSRPA